MFVVPVVLSGCAGGIFSLAIRESAFSCMFVMPVIRTCEGSIQSSHKKQCVLTHVVPVV